MTVLLRVVTSFPVRAAVTLVLLAALAVWIDWGEVVDRVEQGRWQLFVVGVLVVMVALVIGALRWHVFVRAGDIDASVAQTLRAYGIGMFTNNFLPTGFGGDAARAVLIRPAAESTARAVASVVVDRLTALGCLLVLAWLAVAIAPDEVPGSVVGVLAIVSAAGCIVAGSFAVVAHRGESSSSGRLSRQAARLLAQGRAVAGRRSVLSLTTVLGLLYQAAIVFASWIIARSIDVDLSFALLAVVTPLVIVATLMPISIAGFGVREGSYVALLAQAGVSASDATLISLLSVAALAIATLPGGIALLLPGVTPRERVPAP